jgi:hypothetical protein
VIGRLILEIPKSKETESFVDNIVKKFYRNERKGLLLADIAHTDTRLYIITTTGEALTVAFIYSVWLSARKRGIDAKLYFAVDIDPEMLPEYVKDVGRKWSERKLSKEEIESVRGYSVTPAVFIRLLRYLGLLRA